VTLMVMHYLILDAKDQLVRALLPKSLIARLKGQKDTPGIRRDPDDGETPEEEAEERLLRAEDVTYTYDPAGNRVEEKIGGRVIRSTYSPANEMRTRGRITYRYDERGNQIEKEGPGQWHQVVGYNVAGRMTSLGKEFRVGRKNLLREVEKYVYSPDNERVSVEDKVSRTLTQFVWDGGRPIEEWQAVGRGANKGDAGILYARDLGGQLLDQVRYSQNRRAMLADLMGGILDDRDDEDEDRGPRAPKLRHARFVHPDHLGSSSLITNVYGHRLDRLVYGAWGEPLAGNHWRTRFTYTGHQREARTGNYYSVWRYLDPQAGRWTRRDPARMVDGFNLYSYVRNSPISYYDPFGLKCRCENLRVEDKREKRVYRTLWARQFEEENSLRCMMSSPIPGMPMMPSMRSCAEVLQYRVQETLTVTYYLIGDWVGEELGAPIDLGCGQTGYNVITCSGKCGSIRTWNQVTESTEEIFTCVNKLLWK